MNKNKKYKITIRNFFGHLKVIRKHRFKVFCLCCKVGIPWQGFIHDLSKYSIIEFWEGVKYFQGDYSPIKNCKEENGYSKAWLHHKGKNKHHYEYWYDYQAPTQTPIIPFRYVLEMICDSMAAGMVYQGKKWTKEYQLSYWNKVKTSAKIHPAIYNLLERVYTEISEQGIDRVLRRKYLKNLYEEYTKNHNKKEIE